MPYLTEKRKQELAAKRKPITAADLDYLFVRDCDAYLRHHGVTAGHLIEVVGSLVTTALEVYRRLAVPYEDKKIEANGDAFSEEVVQAALEGVSRVNAE